jgi:hypothetical protein
MRELPYHRQQVVRGRIIPWKSDRCVTLTTRQVNGPSVPRVSVKPLLGSRLVTVASI